MASLNLPDTEKIDDVRITVIPKPMRTCLALGPSSLLPSGARGTAAEFIQVFSFDIPGEALIVLRGRMFATQRAETKLPTGSAPAPASILT
jgi:hypothetical protein